MFAVNLAQVLFQLLVFVFTGAGWGWWVLRFARKSRLEHRAEDSVLGFLGGLCACWLVLQNLVYLGVPLRFSSWFAVAIAAAGVWSGLRARQRDASPITLGAIFAAIVVVSFQATALVYHGAGNYYGSAHQDQINYVQLGQFLLDRPFSTGLGDVGLHPWLVKACDIKDMRITQSVAHGYLAAVEFTDVKSAYGATIVSFIGLVPLTVFTLLRCYRVRQTLAALGAVWAGFLPAITQIHLDGFFSQCTVLFVLPGLLIGVYRFHSEPRFGAVIVALLSSFLFGAYSEAHAIGVAMLGSLIFVSIQYSVITRIGLAIGAAVIPLLALPAYSVRFFQFVGQQYRIASDPSLLADLMPYSGTWRGFAQMFMRVSTPSAAETRVVVIAGFLILAFVLLGLMSRHPSRRLPLTAVLGALSVPLVALLSQAELPRYAFAKILILYAPVLVVLGTLGLARLELLATIVVLRPASLLCRPFRAARWATISGSLTAVALAATAAIGSWPQLRSVIANEGILATVNSPAARETYRELALHPERTYLLKEQHVVLNAWLCYHARKADVYVDTDLIGDRRMTSDQFAFRRLPAAVDNFWLLTGARVKSLGSVDASPEITVRNPQGIDRDGLLTWYWVGDAMEIEIFSFAREPGPKILTLRALSGPANASPTRTIVLVPTGKSTAHRMTFQQDGRMEVPITLYPGANLYTLRVEAPTKWTPLPGDGRKLMVRVQELGVTTPPEN